MIAYLDSSVALRAILDEDAAIRRVWELPRVVSSELIEIECRRTFFRYQSERQLKDDELLEALDRMERLVVGLELWELDAPIKRRAMEAFPIRVKTLDALHLSTALAVAQDSADSVAVFSFDQEMNRAAKALGLAAPWYS